MKDLTKLEKNWILYDVGNSAFTLLATTIIPIVFNTLAENKGLSEDVYFSYWGYAVTISTIIVGILGPILGAKSDSHGHRKRWFTIMLVFGSIGCILMPFFQHWLSFLIAYVLTKVFYNSSLVFYDSMLTDVTTPERMDRVSSHGYAWGYVGSTIPFVISIAIIFGKDMLGITTFHATIAAFVINALWWFLFSIPLLKTYEQKHINTENNANQVFQQLWATLQQIIKDRKISLFLLSFFFYIDGVYTIINMATAYGTSLGLDSTGLILALLVTQLVAFPAALYFSKISHQYKTETLIKICIIAYGLIALYAIQLDQLYEFWILAIAVGMFQGAIQALSRSYFAKIIPNEKSGEYFGIFDICGKGASIFGTLIVSLITSFTGNQQYAVASLTFLFIAGFIILNLSLKEPVAK
ncbi:MFS transporter [Globicatella sanguinis]|uniref:MFS transporter n=1 Tax=Globicatella sanguinis TaxID=13076 RepID=UPI002543086E|nr:MFS transporter [Globicatella sanguinis]MDK7631618.1 MFS transporter [Globicatella sanguinis]WIK66861.1 MFS transporter [Globicatella sanguinis]WKT56266.1 MFS transporter [Globicatella sanguinis]